MNNGERPDISDDLTRRVVRHLLPAISVAFLLNYLDRFNISFAGLQMEDSLGLSPIGFGWAGSCFAIGYLLFQIPANIGLMRIGARRWLGLLAISWGLIVCLTDWFGHRRNFISRGFCLARSRQVLSPLLYFISHGGFPRGCAPAQ